MNSLFLTHLITNVITLKQKINLAQEIINPNQVSSKLMQIKKQNPNRRFFGATEPVLVGRTSHVGYLTMLCRMLYVPKTKGD